MLFLAVASLLLLVAVMRYRYLWRSACKQNEDLRQRLDAGNTAQLAQAVDAIAIEVERVGEGQRYLTRILGNREAAQPSSKSQ